MEQRTPQKKKTNNWKKCRTILQEKRYGDSYEFILLKNEN
jgi:hypothetical protein